MNKNREIKVKRCRTCNRVLYHGKFYKSKKEKDDLQAHCKDCSRELGRKYYKYNKERVSRYNKSLNGIINSFNGHSRDRFKEKDIYKDNYIQDISVDMFIDMLTFFDCCCAYTGKPLLDGVFSLDHVQTRSKGGYHFVNNVVPTSKHINVKKGTKNYIDFILEVSSSKEEACKRIVKIMAWQRYALDKYMHLLSDDELLRLSKSLSKAINNDIERANLVLV